MVRNKLAMAVLALSVLQANVAGALGLGNLSVKSALNQPLNAEIKLLDMGDLDASQVKIQLGSADEFQRAAVERDFFLTNLKFNVELDGHGGGVIHIASKEPVVEPYLNFVIEARWPNGRLLREFAVLLDPPTFTANRAAAAVTPAKTQAPAAKPSREPAPQSAVVPPTVASEAPAAAAAPADMSLPAADKGGEYRIQVYDTLSKIAAKHKPASDVSIEQTMIAIQRANPQVFIRNNVNLIKSGYVLRLPTADEARAIAAAQASQEVDEQNKEWRGGSGSARSSAAATGPQLDARAPEPTNKAGGYQEKARLSIATPGDNDKASAGEGSSASGKGLEALRNQLAASQESLEKGKRDNHELQSRLDDMERQIATLQRLISLKDDQLAAMQAKSGADKGAQKEVPATAAAPAAMPAPATPSTEEQTPAPAAPAAATPAPAAAVPTPAAAVKKPAPAPQPEPGLVEQLTENPLYLGGAAAVVLLLGGLAYRRKRQAEAEERESMSDLTFDEGDGFKLDDNVDFEQARIADDAITTAEPAEQVRAETPHAPQTQAVRSETGDAIAESDIYIAYGRYQQAVDLLSHAIDAEPARSDLRVKLLEVCLEMRNKDAFRQQFVALQSLGDADAVAHAKDLLSSVDGVSDWLVDLPQTSRGGGAAGTVAAATAVAAAAAAAAEELELEQPAMAAPSDDVELDLDLKEDAPAVALDDIGDFESRDSELKSDDEEFKFELDDELETEAPVRTVSFDLDSTSIELPSEAAAADEELEIGGDLDLDLDHDDLDAALSEMGETGYLNDLESLSDNLHDLDKPAPAATPAAAFDLDSEELADLGGDDLGAGEELSATDLDLSDEFDLGNVETELPDIDRLDLAMDDEATDFDIEAEREQPLESAATDIGSSALESPVVADTVEAPAGATVADLVDEEAADEFDFLADADEIATKLDLARAYIDMGDTDGAKDILDEVMQEGTDTQKQEASTLLSRIG